MTTERMTDVKSTEIADLFEDERWDTLRDIALRLNRENASLREQLRLAHDKMAEQVRSERRGVAEDALAAETPELMVRFLMHVRDVNAPKE